MSTKSKKTLQTLQAYREVDVYYFRSQDAVSEYSIQLLESYNQLRTDYVLQKDWPMHESGIDMDVYDRFVKNYYVIADHKNIAVAGLRATPVLSIEQSLSYTMWQNAIEYKSFRQQMNDYRKTQTDEKYHMWDITRLITRTSVEHVDDPYLRTASRIGMFKVFAATVSVTDSSTKPSIWYFTLTKEMYIFMHKINVEPFVIAKGKISHSDAAESYLCSLVPSQILSTLRGKNKTIYAIAKRQLKQKSAVKTP